MMRRAGQTEKYYNFALRMVLGMRWLLLSGVCAMRFPWGMGFEHK